jgi:hypothetical protein
MLAYVFWHRPRPDVDVGEYESGLRTLHERLSIGSASFRLAELPFGSGPGYEDWYPVDDWAALGDLNLAAVSGDRRGPHDAVAAAAAAGWGGLYALVRGEGIPPAATRWMRKPPGEGSDRFLAALDAAPIWRRQLVLGPAPEFCLADSGTGGSARERV